MSLEFPYIGKYALTWDWKRTYVNAKPKHKQKTMFWTACTVPWTLFRTLFDCHEVNLSVNTPLVKDEESFRNLEGWTWKIKTSCLARNLVAFKFLPGRWFFVTKWSNGSHSRPILLQFNVACLLLIVCSTMFYYSRLLREGDRWRSLRGPGKIRWSDKSPIVVIGEYLKHVFDKSILLHICISKLDYCFFTSLSLMVVFDANLLNKIPC